MNLENFNNFTLVILCKKNALSICQWISTIFQLEKNYQKRRIKNQTFGNGMISSSDLGHFQLLELKGNKITIFSFYFFNV